MSRKKQAEPAASYDVLVYTFQTAKTGDEALKALRKAVEGGQVEVVTAAAVGKDAAGETTISDSLGTGTRKGLKRGALAGGLLAILAPPVGVIGGLAAGAAAGGLVGKQKEKGAPENFGREFLSRVLAQMGGDSSALIVLTLPGQADGVAAALQGEYGEPIRQELSLEVAGMLMKNGEYTDAPLPGLMAEEVEELRRLVRAGTRRTEPHFERAYVIVNPASGKDQAILNTLNSVFRATGLDWDIGITKAAGDATRLAAQAAEAGYDVVCVYGGDGTVMEAAAGLIDSDTPLGILPGGTNNVMSIELGIPSNLVSAAALVAAAPAQVRAVDMGRANQHRFILRIGAGYEAVINETADREMKDRFGGFAYTLAGLKALADPPVAKYQLSIDGQVEELEGLWCMIANSASLGLGNMELVQGISVSDGLLDVIVVRQADLDSLLSVVSSVSGAKRMGKPLPHWQGKQIKVEAEPPQAVTGDGEIWENTPLEIEVLPHAVNIVVPAEGK